MRTSTDLLLTLRRRASLPRRGLRLTLLVAAVALAGRPLVAHAETFNVGCNAAALASVIPTVNTNGEEDFVWLAPSCVYPLAASWVVQADGGNPVRVHGRATTRISGQDARTPLIVEAGATLYLSNVTVRDGATTARGGAINNAGTLTLNRSTVTESSAQSYGGGIYNTGTARLSGTVVSSNTANIQGGGIDNNGAGARLTLVDSTVSGNASSYGGGIRNGGSAALFNSTLFGNPGFIGGGILNDAAALLSNVTISGNTVTGGNGGGGIRNEGALRLDNSIVANHLSGQADCSNFGTITPLTSNLIEDGSCSVLFAFGGDPKLGSPAGTPASFPLLTGSPAIDAGQNPVCAGADQRGTTRPRDGNNDGYAICDLGAFEWKPKEACGLLGIEAFGVLPLVRLLARARSRRRARRGDAIAA